MGKRPGAVENMGLNGFWTDRNVFVTGATGLLGSWLVESLVEAGAAVTCLVRDWTPESRFVRSGMPERVHVVRGELEDAALLTRALNECEIDTVFHLGAQTIVGTAARSAASTFEANVRGTWNLLEAAKTCSAVVKRIVIASSDTRLPDMESFLMRTSLAGPLAQSRAGYLQVARALYRTARRKHALPAAGTLPTSPA